MKKYTANSFKITSCLNGVTLTGDAALVNACMQKALQILYVAAKKIAAGKANKFTVNSACKRVKKAFCTSFGKSDAERALGQNPAFYDLVCAVRFVVCEVNRCDEKLSETCDKF